jgi:hypothetical protein
LDLLLLSTIAE